MPRSKVIIKDATRDDTQFIAWAVLSAIGHEEGTEEFQKLLPVVTDICSMDNTLYSWRRTRVAVVGGTVVGCLVSYDGAEYDTLRPLTWSLFGQGYDGELPEEVIAANGIETKAGEYYLDSMAVKKAFRGYEIGRMLLEDGIALAKAKKFPRVTLIVESDHPKLKEYYESVGFRGEDHMMFFGDDYTRMAINF